MIITMDGPAGVGKSTLSKMLADKIGFHMLDTGAMYRCVALLKQQTSYSLDDTILQQEILEMDLEFQKGSIFLNGNDVTLLIRTPEIDLLTSQVSVHSFVREQMCTLQRKFAQGKSVVVEGRDMGSNVFPNAELKLYLTADSSVRALRRCLQLKEKNIIKDIEELQKEIEQRDSDDMNRPLNPLCVPEGAIIIDTGNKSQEEVLQEIIDIYNNINL